MKKGISILILIALFHVLPPAGGMRGAFAQRAPENPTRPGWKFQALWGKNFVVPGVYPDSASLPTLPVAYIGATGADSTRGALAYTVAENKIYKYNGTTWSSLGGTTYTDAQARAALSLNFTTTGTSGAATGSYNTTTGAFSINVPEYSGGGVTTMAPIGATPNANGASISGSTLTLQPANASFGGIVTTAAQNFGGDKTFNGLIISSSASSGIKRITYSGGAGLESGEAYHQSGSFVGTQYFGRNNSHGWLWNTGYYNPTPSTTGAISSMSFVSGTFKVNGGFDTIKHVNGVGVKQIWNGGVSDNSGAGVAVSASDRLQFFIRNSLHKFTWNHGGSMQTDGTNEMMRLSQSEGLVLSVPITIGTISTITHSNVTGNKQVYIGTGVQTSGLGVNSATFEIQNFIRNSGWMFTWNHGGFLQATGTNEMMRLKGGSLSLNKGSDAHASAQLEIVSTTRGLLPPRLTQAQRDAIASPATGLTLFCTNCTATDASTGVMQTYNGTTWKNYW